MDGHDAFVAHLLGLFVEMQFLHVRYRDRPRQKFDDG
jgi:hypothetical protein